MKYFNRIVSHKQSRAQAQVLPKITRNEVAHEMKILNKSIIILVLCVFIFLVIFGGICHRIIEVNSEEYDGYVYAAMEFRSGRIPFDPYHPLFFPLLTAGVSFLTGSCFCAAKLISTLSAATLILLVFLIGRLCYSTRVGLLAASLTALNPTVIIEGVKTTTDMLFTTLSIAFLFLILRWREAPLKFPQIILLSLVFSLSYFTRYTAVSLIPLMLILFWLQPNTKKLKKIGQMVLFGILAFIWLIPQFYFSSVRTDDPFRNDSWKNLAFKLYAHGDWSYFNRIPYNGMIGVIAHSPSTFFFSAWAELRDFLTDRITDHLGHGWAGLLLTLLFYVGIGLALWKRTLPRFYLLSFFLFYLFMICFTWTTWQPRHMLPNITICNIVACSVFALPWAGKVFTWKALRITVYTPFFVLIIFLSGWETFRELKAFAARHPEEEYRIAEYLKHKYGPQVIVAGTTTHLLDDLNFTYLTLEDAFGDEVNDPTRYFEKIRLFLSDRRVQYVIVGKISLRSRPQNLLTGDSLPPFLKPIFLHPMAAAYEVKPIK